MRFIFMLLILFGITYYMGFKIYDFFGFNKFVCYGFSILLFLIIIIGFVRSMLPLGESFKSVLGTVSSYVMGFYIYLFLFCLFSDLVLFIIKLFKFEINNIKLYSGFLVLGLVLIVYVYGLINGNNIKHVSYDIVLNEKEDISDLNIIMISDLHIGSVNSEKRLKNIVSEINSKNADLVLFVGDIFDNDYYAIRDVDNVINLFKNINSTYGVYASLGNHDSGSTFDLMMDLLKKGNVNVLMDEGIVIDDRLVVIGRLDKTPIGGYRKDIVRGDINPVIDKFDSSLPLIVLEHNPMYIDEYDERVDLILSGHTHKGQLFPANIITNSMYKVDYGYLDNSKNKVIVSSGVGTWSMPMRVGSQCEIVSINIK